MLEDEKMIPKIIHFCWFGEKEIPKEYRKYIATWKKHCPDYKIVCWTEKKYDIEQCKFMKDAYDKKKWGFVPDYARLDIIYRYGGIYLDTDVEVLRNLDELLENKMFVGLEKGYNMIALGLGFGAEKGHPFVKKLRDRYHDLDFVCGKDGTVQMCASPAIQTPMFKERYGVNFRVDRKYEFDDCVVYPVEYFCPEKYGTGEVTITPNTYLWHHYSASWLSSKQKLVLKLKKFISEYCDDELAGMLEKKLKNKWGIR